MGLTDRIIRGIVQCQAAPMVPPNQAIASQVNVLKGLIKKASATHLGKHYHFRELLNLPHRELPEAFQQAIPLHSYESMYSNWWNKVRSGEPDICWPGYTPYMALSSGTSLGASKFIPVTANAIKSVRHAGLQMAGHLSRLPDLHTIFGLKTLSVSGSTTLSREGNMAMGDFSGILMNELPAWYKHLLLPPKQVLAMKQWQEKLAFIIDHAPRWNPGSISGFPVWVVPMLQAIMAFYRLDSIHDLWPGLKVYMHGGMPLNPYRSALEGCLAKPLVLMETYVASEGYIAQQSFPGQQGMELICNGGLFFEFIPYTAENFDSNGQLIGAPEAYLLEGVTLQMPYAIVLSGNNGAWRYLLGDVVRFTSKEPPTIQWVGRLAQFLNVAGEHVTIRNLEDAFDAACRLSGLNAQHFTVWPDTRKIPHRHYWIVGSDQLMPGFKQQIDQQLGHYNDDYKSQRDHRLLGEPEFLCISSAQFIAWMQKLGKTDAQHKYPRVVNTHQLMKAAFKPDDIHDR